MLNQFTRFAFVGALGFLVDTGVLFGMMLTGLDHHLSRLVSFLCAATFTWALNRKRTFQAGTPRHALEEWLHYLAAMAGGGVVNLGTYALVMATLPHHAWGPALAVGAGSVAGLAINFVSARYWVFRPAR